MSRFTTQGGGSGTPGPTGPQGPAGQDANTADFSFVESTMSTDGNMDIAVNGVPGEITLSAYAGVNINTNAAHALNTTNVLPLLDNTYTLGDADHRWKSISIGEGTIYITDAVTGDEAALTIADGVFFIDGIAQAQLPDLAVTNLTFNDNTTQTTAAVAQINSDWNATTGKAQILNKPDLSGYLSEPTPTSYNPVWSGTGLTFTGTPATGSYMKIGKMVTFRIKVLCTNVTNFGTGSYSITLPFAPVDHYMFRDGGSHSGANHYMVGLDAYPGTTTAELKYVASQSQDGDMDHNHPKTFSTTDFFYISGTYESV